MTPRRQFAVVLISVLVITSVISHALAKLSGIDTRLGHMLQMATNYSGPPVLVAGSSMIGVALDYDAMAADLRRPIDMVSTASASPCELDTLTKQAPPSDLTIVSASIYDLDEDILADFRAGVVPLDQTVRDLWNADSDWAFAKRTVSRYPLHYLQWIYPSAGRSMGILAGTRNRIASWRHQTGEKSDELPTVEANHTITTARVTDWPPARVLRNIAHLRGMSCDHHEFHGPKRLALLRMLHRLVEHGKVIVIILPVSPPYNNQFLTPADHDAFEKEIAEAARAVPQVHWFRMDQLPGLDTSDVFSDLFHVNDDGHKIISAAFHSRLKAVMQTP